MNVLCSILGHLRTRPLAVALLAYQFLFLNVMIPGHTRGAITTDGKHASSCCCRNDGAADDRPSKGPAAPSQRDRDHCALCDFAARVTPPEAFVLRLDPIGLLAILPAPAPAVATSLDRIATYLGTGPPLAHA